MFNYLTWKLFISFMKNIIKPWLYHDKRTESLFLNLDFYVSDNSFNRGGFSAITLLIFSKLYNAKKRYT